MKKSSGLFARKMAAILLATLMLIISIPAVGANLHSSNITKTIDELWVAVGGTETSDDIDISYSLVGEKLSYLAFEQGNSAETRNHMTIGFENEESDNVVLKSGTLENPDGIITYRGIRTEMGAQRIQRWEAKVKLSSTSDLVYVLPYTMSIALYPYYYKHGNMTSGVKIENGAAYVSDLENSASGYTYKIADSLAPDQWYKVVRYMDFSINEKNMHQSFLYQVNQDGSETLIGSTGDWLQAGNLKYYDANTTVYSIGVDIPSAQGQVMIDDIGASAPTMPSMSVMSEYAASEIRNGTIDELWEEFGSEPTLLYYDDAFLPKTSNLGYKPYGTGASARRARMNIDYESGSSDNVVLKTGDESGNYDGIISYGVMPYVVGEEKFQKWEVKVNVSSNSDNVNVLNYHSGSYTDQSFYNLSGSGVEFRNGNVYIRDNGTEVTLYSGIEAGRWYKVVRYIDFSVEGINMNRVLLFQITQEAGEELLADSGNTWLQAGNKPLSSAGYPVVSVSMDALTASGPVMFDDFFVSKVYSYDEDDNLPISADTVKIIFNTRMNPISLNPSAVTFTANGANTEIENASFDENSNTATIKLGSLRYGTDYVLTVGKQFMGAGDEVLFYPNTDVVKTFSTAADPLTGSNIKFYDEEGDILSSEALLSHGQTVMYPQGKPLL